MKRSHNRENKPTDRLSMERKIKQEPLLLDTSFSEIDTPSVSINTNSGTFTPPKKVKITHKDSSVYDIDKRDANNPLLCSEYSRELFDFYKELEKVHRIDDQYLSKQFPIIDAARRARIVKGMIEVHYTAQLIPEVLYLAVNILDRYLATVGIGEYVRSFLSDTRDENGTFSEYGNVDIEIATANESDRVIKLLTVGSLMIAIKFENAKHFSINTLLKAFKYQKLISLNEVTDIEIDILCAVRGYVNVPTIFTFLCRYVRAGFANKLMVQIACYIADTCLLSYGLLKYYPSLIAASCVYIARKTHHIKKVNAIKDHQAKCSLSRALSFQDFNEISPIGNTTTQNNISLETIDSRGDSNTTAVTPINLHDVHYPSSETNTTAPSIPVPTTESPNHWTSALEHYTGYSEEKVLRCVKDIQSCCFPETMDSYKLNQSHTSSTLSPVDVNKTIALGNRQGKKKNTQYNTPPFSTDATPFASYKDSPVPMSAHQYHVDAPVSFIVSEAVRKKFSTKNYGNISSDIKLSF